MLLLGVTGAAINVPAIVDLMDFFKTRMKLDEAQANDMASAVYNLAINFGEAIGPIFGGYVTNVSSFTTSCVCTGVLILGYTIFFGTTYYNLILEQIEECKREKELAANYKIRDGDDDFYTDNRLHTEKKIEKEYVGRYRARSYSNRSSARASYAELK